MYPVRPKGPQQLRREERMRAEMAEAESLLVRLVAGERVGLVRRPVRGFLSLSARNPGSCHEPSLRPVPVRSTAAAALRVPNLSAAELDTFVQVAKHGDVVVAGLLGHPNAGYPTKLRAIAERARMTHGHVGDGLYDRYRSDPRVAAAILLSEALPLEPLYVLEDRVSRLLAGGAPALETFATLWRDAHRSDGMAAQRRDVVDVLLDQVSLVLA